VRRIRDKVSLQEGWAIDVNYRHRSAAEQKAIRDAAAAVGLGWGGIFPKNDDVRFYGPIQAE
jgi:hypothetical protein